MKKAIVTMILSTAFAAQAADLTSCSATYTVAAAAFSQANDPRSADGAAYLASQTKQMAMARQWGNNQQLSASMYKQALSVQQGRFKSGGWPALSQDLNQCRTVVDRHVN